MAALEQECQKAQGHIQELLDEGQTQKARPEGQNWYRDLQAQKSAMEVQLNGQLKVAAMEIDGLKKRVAQEFGFSKKQSGEITRLSGEISRLNSEKDMLAKELQDLKSARQPAAAPWPLTRLQRVPVCHLGHRMGPRSRRMRKCLDSIVQTFRHTGWQLQKLPMLVRVDRHRAMVRHSICLRHPRTSIRDLHRRSRWP